MKRLFPSVKVAGVFAVLAVICATLVSRFSTSSHDLGLAALAMPVFVFGAVLGLRKSPQWNLDAEEAGMDIEEAD